MKNELEEIDHKITKLKSERLAIIAEELCTDSKAKTFRKRICAKLKQERERLEIKQQEVADLLGYSRSHIANIELGNINIGLDLLFKLCKLYRINPEYLFD